MTCYCGGTIMEDLDKPGDDRVEWKKTFFKCKECGTTYTRRTEYQPQSILVASDELTIDDTPENRERAWQYILPLSVF